MTVPAASIVLATLRSRSGCQRYRLQSRKSGGHRIRRDSSMKRIFKTKYPPSVIEKALRDYQSSQMTTERIAKKYRVCTASLTVWAKRAGLPLRQRGRRRMTEPNSRQRAIIEMAGILKYSAVANAFGITKQGVYRIVRRWKRPAEADRTNESPTAQLPKPPVGSSNSLTDDDITGDIERVIAKAVNPYVDV